MATLNYKQIERVAEFIGNLPEHEHGLNFYSFGDHIATDMYPDLNNPQVINFFFFVCMHQYGFWYGDNNGYLEPLVGLFHGKEVKGSDLLWKVCKRTLDVDSEAFEPARLAEISPRYLSLVFNSDQGPVVWPDFDTRFQLTRAYGQWFVENETSPVELVRTANDCDNVLCVFLSKILNVPGYNKDNLQKKQLLLAMVLANRPEHFLEDDDSDEWPPIVDYHLMRLALRLGLVDLTPGEEKSNKNRNWISPEEEGKIRDLVFLAVEQLIESSGRSMSFVDYIMWSGRRYCPEMQEPNCSECIFTDVCKKRTNLFQPVLRTTAY